MDEAQIAQFKQAGAKAAEEFRLLEVDDCPHKCGTVEAIAWRIGFVLYRNQRNAAPDTKQ